MKGGFASGSWEGRPRRRPVPMQERLTRLTAHREFWIFILFLTSVQLRTDLGFVGCSF